MIPILILATVITLCSGICWWFLRKRDKDANHYDREGEHYEGRADRDVIEPDVSDYDTGGGDGGGFDGGI